MVPSILPTRCTSAPVPTVPSSTSSTRPTGKRGPSEGGYPAPPGSAARGPLPRARLLGPGRGARVCLASLASCLWRFLKCSIAVGGPIRLFEVGRRWPHLLTWTPRLCEGEISKATSRSVRTSPKRGVFFWHSNRCSVSTLDKCSFFPCHPGMSVSHLSMCQR